MIEHVWRDQFVAPIPVQQEARELAQRADMHHDAIYGAWHELGRWPEHDFKLLMRVHPLVDKFGVKHLTGSKQEMLLCPLSYQP